jgi:hypothetical protein
MALDLRGCVSALNAGDFIDDRPKGVITLHHKSFPGDQARQRRADSWRGSAEAAAGAPLRPSLLPLFPTYIRERLTRLGERKSTSLRTTNAESQLGRVG